MVIELEAGSTGLEEITSEVEMICGIDDCVVGFTGIVGVIELTSDKYLELGAAERVTPGGGVVAAMVGSGGALYIALKLALTRSKKHDWDDI